MRPIYQNDPTRWYAVHLSRRDEEGCCLETACGCEPDCYTAVGPVEADCWHEVTCGRCKRTGRYRIAKLRSQERVRSIRANAPKLASLVTMLLDHRELRTKDARVIVNHAWKEAERVLQDTGWRVR